MMDRMPTAADFNARRVTNPSQSEVTRQRLYDYQLMNYQNVTQLSFFQQPVGSGLTSALGGTVGSVKTLWDTNMSLGGTLPSGSAFLVESIEILFFPGSVTTSNTYTPVGMSVFNATAAAAVAGQVNDVNTFYQSGMLTFNILAKTYLRETPLLAFPPKANFALDAALASNSATTAELAVINARASGRPYYIDPSISLQPAVNFEVIVSWPSAITLSGNARVGCILDGYFMRASQ